MKPGRLQEEVLHSLVDKYENRKDYASDKKSPRRTFLKIDRKYYPDYYHVSDSSFRLMFNQEMQQLQQQGYVELEWERFNEGEYLNKIVLNSEFLPEIYALLNRASRKELYRSAAHLVEKWSRQSHVEMQPFYRYLLDRLERLQPLPSPIKPGREAEMEQLLRGMHAFFESRESEISKRILSVRLYRDSKRWESLEKSILHLLRKFCLNQEEASREDRDILAERGIVDNPVHINISGPLVFSTCRGQVNLASFYPDLGLSPEMANELEVVESRAEAVVTVENKASFYQYLREGPAGRLVLYLGGYHNPPRRVLLQKIYRYFEDKNINIPFYHWGDMDLGGINIWYTLKTRTNIPFQPVYMDVDTFRGHLDLAQDIDEDYCRRIKSLLQNPELEIFHPLIREMLHFRKRVEQEAVEIT